MNFPLCHFYKRQGRIVIIRFFIVIFSICILQFCIKDIPFITNLNFCPPMRSSTSSSCTNLSRYHFCFISKPCHQICKSRCIFLTIPFTCHKKLHRILPGPISCRRIVCSLIDSIIDYMHITDMYFLLFCHIRLNYDRKNMVHCFL